MWIKSIAKREANDFWSVRTLARNFSSLSKMISMKDKEDDENDDTDTAEKEVKTDGDDTDTEESDDNDIEEEEVKAEGDDTDTEEGDDTDLEEEEVKAEGDDTDTEKSDDTDAEEDEAVYKVKLDPEVYERRTVDDPAVEITGAAENIEEETERVNTGRYKKTDSMKIHHASLKIAGHNYDDNAVPYKKMMHQSRTCERNSWPTTSMVLANLYPQLLQLNLCFIFLGCFALRNNPRTICSFNQKKEEDDQDSPKCNISYSYKGVKN